MRIQLSDHFSYGKLLRFTLSTILMLICTSMYSIVDGFFVSNYVGKTAFAAVNLIYPVSMGVTAIGFMLGTGGSAIVSKTLGQGDRQLANRYFSLIIYVAIGAGAVLSGLCFAFTPQIAALLGVQGALMQQCVVYGRILFLAQGAFMLQTMFQTFFVAAEKPGLSLKINLLAGATNMVFDYLFVAVLPWGLAGAAAATAMSQVVGGVVPLIYFARKNDSLLRLTLHTKFYGRVLLKTCTNGSSEMVTNLSASVVNILYNFQLMRLAGENGVAADGVIMYVNFIFMAVFLGYSIGSAPVVSYHYGAGNHTELKRLFRKSLVLLGAGGLVLTVLAEAFSAPLVAIFASYDAELYAMTVRGFRLYSLAFLIMGVNVWGSAFFTALNNGAISAAISFLRTFVFQVAVVLALPALIGLDGIWLAIVVAEALALLVTAAFLAAKREYYHYG